MSLREENEPWGNLDRKEQRKNAGWVLQRKDSSAIKMRKSSVGIHSVAIKAEVSQSV